MTKGISNKKGSANKYKTVFATYVGLKQYLAEKGINWDKETITAFEMAVRLAFQMISNESFYVDGRRGEYVFPREFLDSYLKCVTLDNAEVKAFGENFTYEPVLHDAIKGGIRDTLDMHELLSITDAERLTTDEIGRVAQKIMRSVGAPLCKLVCLDQKTGKIGTEPEYSRSLLDTVDWLGQIEMQK